MASTRPQQRRPAASQRGRVHRQAQPGGRFSRTAPPPARGRIPRRRPQPQPNRAEKLMQLVQGGLPGGGSSRAKRSGGGIPLVGGLLGGGKSRGKSGRGKPALLGVLGAGAAGAAMAARRRKNSGSTVPVDTEPAPEPRTVPPTPSDADKPAADRSD